MWTNAPPQQKRFALYTQVVSTLKEASCAIVLTAIPVRTAKRNAVRHQQKKKLTCRLAKPGISPGIIAGIAVAVVLVILALLVAAYFLYNRGKIDLTKLPEDIRWQYEKFQESSSGTMTTSRSPIINSHVTYPF